MSSAQYYEQSRGDLPPEALNSQQQPDGYGQSRGNLAPEADTTAASSQFGPGTDVMGAPVNPLSESTQANAVDPASAGTRAPPSYDYATQANSADASQAPTSNFPTTHLPKSAGTGGSNYEYATPANGPNTAQAPAGNFPSSQMPQNLSQSGAASQQQPGVSPYVQTPSVPGATGKSPMDSIMGIVNKFSKRAEETTGNVWGHLRTGPNVADTAMGRLALGTRAISEGGLENVYRQTFEVGPDEHLLKTYACYLSTSTGPVAGTLYISTQNLAFSSDRPLAIPTSPGAGNVDATNEAAATKKSSASKKTSAAAQQQQQQHQYCYYKVMVPISKVESVNPSENTKKKPVEKYIQVKTSDGHEFWFMGFVNYDKGVKNLQEALLSRNTNPTTATPTSFNSNNPSTNTTPNPGSYNANNDPTYTSNTPSSYSTTPGSYNTNTDPTYASNTPSSYNATPGAYNANIGATYNTPGSYNTNTDPSYNTNTPSSYNTNTQPNYTTNTPSSYNTNTASTHAPSSYNNTSNASPVV